MSIHILTRSHFPMVWLNIPYSPKYCWHPSASRGSGVWLGREGEVKLLRQLPTGYFECGETRSAYLAAKIPNERIFKNKGKEGRYEIKGTNVEFGVRKFVNLGVN